MFHRVLVVAMVYIVAAHAFTPGSNATACATFVDETDRLIMQRTEATNEYSRFEGTAFGTFSLVPADSLAPDGEIFVYHYVSNETYGEYITYAPQPVIDISPDAPIQYLDYSDFGWGVGCGVDAIIPIFYDEGTAFFVKAPTIAATDISRCYISVYRILAYDDVSAVFNQYLYDDFGGTWAQSISQPTIPANSSIAVFNERDHTEFCYLVDNGTITTQFIECVFVPGVPTNLNIVRSVFQLPTGIDVSMVTDMQFDNVQDLIVGFDSSGSGASGQFAVYQRDANGELEGPPTQISAVPLLDSLGLAAHIATNDEASEPGLLWLGAPFSEPGGPNSRGDVHLYRANPPGSNYVFVDTLLSEFETTGAYSNIVGRPDIPQMAFFSDPFQSIGYISYGYADAVAGQLAEVCSETEWCAGSCGPNCNILPGDACSIDRFNTTSGNCESVGTVDPDDGNVCTVDTCDPLGGIMHTPVGVATVCPVTFMGLICPGICQSGICSIDGPCVPIMATSTPTPTPTTTSTPTTTPSFMPSPSITPSPTISQSPSASPSFGSLPSCTLDDCPPTDGGACNTISNCYYQAGPVLVCEYDTHDNLCPPIANADHCEIAVCDPSMSTDLSGCMVASAPVGSDCDNDRLCHTPGICAVDGECRVTYDDSVCSQASDSICGVNQCVRDIHDVGPNIDENGCRMVSTGGYGAGMQCISPDPCIVTSPQSPAFCNPETFLCEGGAEVECADGAECNLGACVILDCRGDDDDCYRPDDDDDDGISWDDWKAPLIVGAILVMCLCFCWVFVIGSRRMRDDADDVVASESIVASSGSGRSKRSKRKMTRTPATSGGSRLFSTNLEMEDYA